MRVGKVMRAGHRLALRLESARIIIKRLLIIESPTNNTLIQNDRVLDDVQKPPYESGLVLVCEFICCKFEKTHDISPINSGLVSLLLLPAPRQAGRACSAL